MYLKTTKRKNRDGSSTTYFHLAHNERDPKTGTPVPRIVHNFGRADTLDHEKLVRLCKSIARVCNVEVVQAEDTADGGQSYIKVLDDLTVHETKQAGVVLAVEQLWENLELGKNLRAVAVKEGKSAELERALLMMVANRLCVPSSKLGAWQRWLATVYMPTCEDLKLGRLYAAMDLLQRHADAIEEKVFFCVADLLSLEVDVVFYDTTTASFSIDEEDAESSDANAGVRKRGRSKTGVWTPQVVVALAVTRDGIPVRSWVFDGNTSDVTTIQQVRKDLKGWKLGRALFVADAGMNSQESRKELAKGAGTYLLASRMRSVKEIREEVVGKRGRFTKVSDNLQAKEVIVGKGVRARRYILCFNPKEAERQVKHRRRVLSELRQKLSAHRNRNASAKWAMELKVSKRFGQYLRTTIDGRLEIDREATKAAARFDGKWVIETNDDTMTLEDAANGYKALLVIERCFRSMKSAQIKLTPIHHRTRQRIEAHVKICVLALLLERVAERTCREPWSRISERLARLQVTELRGGGFKFWQRNEPSEAALKTLKQLQVPVPKRILGLEPL